MILFVGISFILLNRQAYSKQAYSKMQEINKAYQDFFINSPFIKKIQVSFGTNPKLINDSNSTDTAADCQNSLPITHAIQLLNFDELQFRVVPSDKINSEDSIVPFIVAKAEEVTSEEQSTDTVPEVESLEEILSEDVLVDNAQSFEKDDIELVEPTHTETIEETVSTDDDVVTPLPLGLVDQCKLMNLTSKNVHDSKNSAGNSSILRVAKTIDQFNLDGTALEKINLAGLDQQVEKLADSCCVTLPIQPVTFPSVGIWSNYRPFKKPLKSILINPLMLKSGITANKMVKTTGIALNLLKRVAK